MSCAASPGSTGRRWGILAARIRSAVLHAPFAPAVVIAHPTAALAAYLQERPGEFPGFKVEGESTRSYPQGAFGSEFLGLLGQISEPELKSHAYTDAKPGEVVGQSGVEAAYDHVLNAGFVQAKIPVDSLGRIVGPLRVPPQKQPPTLQLSIDSRLQKAAQRALLYGMEQSRLNGHSPTGASAVAIDPWTGAIKAIVSYPTFDQKRAAEKPNYLRAALQADARDAPPEPGDLRRLSHRLDLQADHRRGRAERRDHHAGHAALLHRRLRPRRHVFHNVDPGVNASMTLPTALEVSCDTWFYRLGDLVYRHDPRAQGTLIQNWARKLGLGHAPPGDLTGATSGYLPGPGRIFEQDVRLPLDGRADDQPRDRPGRPAGEPAPTRGRLLGADQRRQGRPAARGRGRDPGRRHAQASTSNRYGG